MKHLKSTTHIFISALLWLSSAARLPSSALAFQPSITTSSRTRCRRKAVIPHVSLQQVDEKPPKVTRIHQFVQKDDPSALTFSGQIIKTSPPLVQRQDKDRLIEFFKSSEARNTLFVSDAPPVPINSVSPQLFQEWQSEAERVGAVVPERSEQAQQSVMQLCSNGISFSGLTVETTVFCGAKLIDNHDGTGLPAYEFTMIKDKTHARGPKPLMWIYNQVMNFVARNNNNESDSSDTKTTTSLCRVTLIEKKEGLVMHFESSFQVKMKFPPFLLKVLPVSKTRAERQGSSAVKNFVEKGVVNSLQRFQATFAKSTMTPPL